MHICKCHLLAIQHREIAVIMLSEQDHRRQQTLPPLCNLSWVLPAFIVEQNLVGILSVCLHVNSVVAWEYLGHQVKTWCRPQNRKYIKYRNAVRGKSSCHRWSVVFELGLCERTDKQTDILITVWWSEIIVGSSTEDMQQFWRFIVSTKFSPV